VSRRVVTIVDPPEGWKYGFPAILESDYRLQLERAGYPSGLVELAMNYSRYWTEYLDEWEKKSNVEDQV